mgnify:CR=1 FL=1
MIIGNWVIPTLIAHGNEEQLAKFVPPSLRGDIVWCQLFSEPGAGSDLAGLKTKAERKGDQLEVRVADDRYLFQAAPEGVASSDAPKP